MKKTLIMLTVTTALACSMSYKAFAAASSQGCDSSGGNASGCTTNNGGNGGSGGNGGGGGSGGNGGVGNGGNGGNGGVGNGGNGGVGNGGSATGGNSNNSVTNTVTGGAVTNTNTNTNTNGSVTGTNTNGSVTGTNTNTNGSVSSSQSQTNTGNNSANTNAGNSVSINTPKQVAGASGPALAVGDCLGSMSGGVQTGVFGLSLGGTKDNDKCNRRANAAMLHNLGLGKAASALMCQDAAVAQAMEDAGTPCPAKSEVVAKASAKTTEDTKVRNRKVVNEGKPFSSYVTKDGLEIVYEYPTNKKNK